MEMFGFAAACDQPIGDWDVGNLRTMSKCFGMCPALISAAASFKRPTGDWDSSDTLK